MKRVVLYIEIQGLGESEDGEPTPVGLKVDFGTEIEDEKYEELMDNINPDFEMILSLMGLDTIASPENCRLISEQEYIENYGDD